jgi:heptosyltransferase-2
MLSQAYGQVVNRDTHNVLFHMWPSGARAYLKEWPEAYWIELARYFDAKGYKVYLSGAPIDKPQNEAFICKAGVKGLVNIAGAYDLSELAAFVQHEIECAVSVNTGILHLVASLKVPLIGLHGPTNPLRWGPLGVNATALLPASGNFAYLNYGFEYPKDDATAYALDKLTVQQVIDAFEHQSAARK